MTAMDKYLLIYWFVQLTIYRVILDTTAHLVPPITRKGPGGSVENDNDLLLWRRSGFQGKSRVLVSRRDPDCQLWQYAGGLWLAACMLYVMVIYLINLHISITE
jgi:hypothetical protein